MPIRFSADAFPVMMIQVEGELGSLEGESLQQGLLENFMRAESEDVWMFGLADARRVTRLGPMFRRAMTEFEAEHEDLTSRRLGGRVVVTDRAIVRGAMTAVAWVHPRLKSLAAEKEPAAALARLERQAAEKGQPITETQRKEVLAFFRNTDG